MSIFSLLRAAAPSAGAHAVLGPLAELAGDWSGSGFNLIAVPNKQNGSAFRLILNTTNELITFSPIGGPVPDRGSVQGDINLFGLTYLQRVFDAQTKEQIHIEPGTWLNVPQTSDPAAQATIVRQSTIPHGDVLLAQGLGSVYEGGPSIKPVSSKPTGPGLQQAGFGYLDPYLNSDLPPGMKQIYVDDMSQALVDAINGQKIVKTTVLNVATAPNGGVLNIPFVTTNANAVSVEAIFWIETVERPDKTQFLQLQYAQKVILNFLDIDWPHISVATLIKV